MTNDQIAAQLSLIGKLLELKGENPFKVRAYATASDAIEAADISLEDTVRAGNPISIGGLGSGMQALVKSLVETGTAPLLEQLRAEIPAGVIELSQVKGIGPKKLETLWKEQGITSPEELARAIHTGALANVKGLGGKTVEAIQQALAYYIRHRGQMRMHTAWRLAERLTAWLQQAPGVQRVQVTGEVRRACPVVDRLTLVVSTTDDESLWHYLHSGLQLLLNLERNDATWTGETAQHQRVELQVGSPQIFPVLVLLTSFPEAPPPELLQAAQSAIPLPDGEIEAHIFAAAGLPYVDPALRDLPWEAQKRLARVQLVAKTDLLGVVHNHSKWSDGTRTIREMAEAAQRLGYQYLGLADHSRTAAYAGGLSIERVAAQHAEIDALNRELTGFRILKGIESDILMDGSLDYPPDVLETFDFIVASIHQNFRMDEATATRRLIRAIENPYTTILGHPTGRLLLSRPGYPVDSRQVIDACAANGVALEVNANPYRLDVDWTWLPYALERGVRISINPDAHSIEEYDYVRYGLAMARKAGLTAAQTLNALPVEGFLAFARKQAA